MLSRFYIANLLKNLGAQDVEGSCKLYTFGGYANNKTIRNVLDYFDHLSDINLNALY